MSGNLIVSSQDAPGGVAPQWPSFREIGQFYHNRSEAEP